MDVIESNPAAAANARRDVVRSACRPGASVAGWRLLRRCLPAVFIAITWLGTPVTARAHKPSDTYLQINVDDGRLSGRWDIALRDLEYAVGIDQNGDGDVTWGELQARRKAIEQYALPRLTLSSAGATGKVIVNDFLVEEHNDGYYAVLGFDVEGVVRPRVLEIDYRAFFDLDPLHRGLLQLNADGTTQTAVFAPHETVQRFEVSTPSRWRQFAAFTTEGVWHIWIGFDHILFLVALLLPSVLQRTPAGWEVVGTFRKAFINVLKVVTAFTIAHSITLTLATLKLVELPSRFVEATIAASVVLAALNNFVPLFRDRGWLVAFVFGIIHGFGFASVLADLGLPTRALALALFGFNVGVELGQLAIVAVFLPLAFSIRWHWLYRTVTLKYGSGVIALIAACWMVERMFDVKLLF